MFNININDLSITDIIIAFVITIIVIERLIKITTKIKGYVKVTYNKIKHKEQLEQKIETNEDKIDTVKKEIDVKIDLLTEKVDILIDTFSIKTEQSNEINKMLIRKILVEACLTALDRGCIEATEMDSIEDLYKPYHDVLSGNGYVQTLVEKCRRLRITNIHSVEK